MRKWLKRLAFPALTAALSLTAWMTAFAEETVKVTVPNVKGGYLEVQYSEAGDFEDKPGQYFHTVYLPIGETTTVPEGVNLRITPNTTSFLAEDGQSIKGALQSLTVNGEKMDMGGSRSINYRANADLVLDAVFKGELNEANAAPFTRAISSGNNYSLYFDHEGENNSIITAMEKPGKLPDQKLKLYNYVSKENVDFSKAENLRVETCSYINTSNEVVLHDSTLFTISKDGILRAKEPLTEYGTYECDGSFENAGEKRSFSLYIRVGGRAELKIPFVAIQYGSSSNILLENIGTASKDYYVFEGLDLDKATYQDALRLYEDAVNKNILAGHKVKGIGRYNATTKKFTSLADKKVKDSMSPNSLSVTAQLLFEGYEIPVVEPLTLADVVVTVEEPGWHQINGRWYYYDESDLTNPVKNQWVIRNGKDAWVGDDGAMVVNGIAGLEGDQYWVNENGEKTNISEIKIIDGMEYIFENGKLMDVKLHLATPSNADEAKDTVERLSNILIAGEMELTEEEQTKAADILVAGLKKISNGDMTEEQVDKYDEALLQVYGSAIDFEYRGSLEAVDIDPDFQLGTIEIRGGIAASGITSKDFEDGTVKIEYVLEQAEVATSSNASKKVEFDLKLFVNGEEVKDLVTPIYLTISMPDSFVASYSNAAYDYKVKFGGTTNAADLSEDGSELYLTVEKLGVYAIVTEKKTPGTTDPEDPDPEKPDPEKPVDPKPSKPSSKGSGSGGGTKTKAPVVKPGAWVQGADGRWWFRFEDGTWPKSQWLEVEWNGAKYWYYFDANGYMATGWQNIEGTWYYLNPSAEGNTGFMCTGWQQIDGKWYYFINTAGPVYGGLLTNATTPDGYQVNENGEWIQ